MIILSLLLALSLSACVPISDPSNWDPTVYCKTVQKLFGPGSGCDKSSKQGPEFEMICRTSDGYRFTTGLVKVIENHWICDHVGMGEG